MSIPHPPQQPTRLAYKLPMIPIVPPTSTYHQAHLSGQLSGQPVITEMSLNDRTDVRFPMFHMLTLQTQLFCCQFGWGAQSPPVSLHVTMVVHHYCTPAPILAWEFTQQRHTRLCFAFRLGVPFIFHQKSPPFPIMGAAKKALRTTREPLSAPQPVRSTSSTKRRAREFKCIRNFNEISFTVGSK